MNTRTQLLSAALAALALTACTTTPRGSQNAYSGAAGTHSMESIEGNKQLASTLRILDPRSRRNADGRMALQFELKNTTPNALQFAWAVDWFDAGGFRIDDVTRHWEPVNLGGHGSTILKLTSPTPAAESWKLHVTSRDEVK